MRKMKFLVLAVMGLLCSMSVSAHDFKVDGLYCNILSEEDKTVEVTYYGSTFLDSYNEYSGHVNIPATVTYRGSTYSVVAIGESTFAACERITGVTIPPSVTRIDQGAFSVNEFGGVDFSNVYISDLEAWCNIDFAAPSYGSHPFVYAENFYLNGQLMNDIVVPDGVKEIKNYAFYNFPGESITIPCSVDNIGYGAFANSRAICVFLNETPITYNSFLGNHSIVMVSEDALESYRNAEGWNDYADRILTEEQLFLSIEIVAHDSESAVDKYIEENNITSIYSLSLKGTINSYDVIALNKHMPYLRHLDLSEVQIVACNHPYYQSYCTVDNTLSSYMFYQHPSLRSIKLPKQMMGSMGEGVFYNCRNLQEVVLPSGITSIGDEAFWYCKALKRVNIPMSVTSIGYNAFLRCSSMTSIDIPSNVIIIRDLAFEDCNNLKSIFTYISAENLFPIKRTYKDEDDDEHGVFRGVDTKNSILHVPHGAKDAYASTEGWNQFKNIVEMAPTEYNLSISDAGYATLYLNSAAIIPEGVEVYTAEEVENYWLKMNLVESILPANTGAIVKASAGTYTFVYSATETSTIADNLLKGSATDAYIDVPSNSKAFVLSMVDGEVGMYPAKLTEGRFLNNANKAYLLLDNNKLGLSDEELDTSVGGAQLSLRFDFGSATGIDAVQTETEKVIYDLYGRKVKQITGSGLYIIGGKKVYVR